MQHIRAVVIYSAALSCPIEDRDEVTHAPTCEIDVGARVDFGGIIARSNF
jgi:hypothetical protein